MASQSSLTASSSSSPPPRTWTYRVFASFHGPDVRKTFLSHLRKQFDFNGISMFNDQVIKRSETIAPALTKAIKNSRISIVVLSMNYASSSWCLDELVDILKCKEDIGQIVMTVFYGVDPSDVRKQTGEFGRIFKKTCARKTEEERRKWSRALKDVGNIAGEHFLNWKNESEMIEKIARDVSNKLNVTISRDFEDIVGIEVHLKKMQSLLHLDYEDESMIVGICGPAGIGKSTIARVLHSRLSNSFQLTCFMEHVRGSCNSGLDEYGLKLCLQEKLLSKILNQTGMKINHLGMLPERLHDQKVLIILDDVDDLKQLEALAKETNWFGPGSRVIVTTEDQGLLEQHDINNIYHVGFPTEEEARKIFCRYAFGQSLAPHGFGKLAERVTKICSNLPLGLRVMGSSLRGKKEDKWEPILHRLESRLDRRIEGLLSVGYDNLHKDDQLLFLLIVFFFNYKDVDDVMAMLSESKLDVKLGLETLTSKSLIQISTEEKIVMHKLLQQMGREANERQYRGESQILTNTNEICDVFENDHGSGSLMGISLDISTLRKDVHISAGAFKRIHNLLFLSIYGTRFEKNVTMHVHEEMDFPTQLRLLHWEEYPRKCLPNTFRPQNLVELNFKKSKLEKLWEGIQPLANLKKMNLGWSSNLKELPNLSNATNLKTLNLNFCNSLVEIHPSIGSLHKLEWLMMNCCVNLQVVPTHFNLASLQRVDMFGSWQLRKFPYISTNISEVVIPETVLEDFLGSNRLWPRLRYLSIYGSVHRYQERTQPDIERIPDCIKDLHGLENLYIEGCTKLASMPELPRSLRKLVVADCESLETITSFPFDSPHQLWFFDCLKLGEEARRIIVQQSSMTACLPGRNIPAEFNHRAIGNSLTFPLESQGFNLCVVISTKDQILGELELFGRQSRNGIIIWEQKLLSFVPWLLRTEHIYIINNVKFRGKLNGELLLETSPQNVDIIECGFQIWTDQTDSSYEHRLEQMSEDEDGSYEPRSEQISEDDDDDSDRLEQVSEDLTWYRRVQMFFCVFFCIPKQ